MTTTVEKWFVFSLGATIYHETTEPTGPWLDNGPTKEYWYIIERGGNKRKLQLTNQQIEFDDGGSKKLCFTSGEWLFIPHQILESNLNNFDHPCSWCGSNAYKIK